MKPIPTFSLAHQLITFLIVALFIGLMGYVTEYDREQLLIVACHDNPRIPECKTLKGK